jgi:hypothetical protein
MSLSSSYYGLSGDQLYLTLSRTAGNPVFLTGSLLITQSVAPVAKKDDSTIFEPYITSINYYNSDDNPIINNAVDNRQSTTWEDLDYSQGALIPVNFITVISGSATKASVQDSNYSTIRHINPRYRGSRNTTDNFNTASISNTLSIENSQNIYLGPSDTLYPSVTYNDTGIYEFAFGGGAYPEVATGGGVLISQILNVSGTSSIDVVNSLDNYFEDTLRRAFLPNDQPLVTQYSTNINVSNARVASTIIGIPTISNYMVPSSAISPNVGVISSLTDVIFNQDIWEVTTGTGGYYTTGSAVPHASALTIISESIAQGNDWYITLYENLPTLVQGTLQPFNTGSANDYSGTDNNGNYIYPLTVNGVYQIIESNPSSGLTINPPAPQNKQIGAGVLGCLIWESTKKPLILFNDATFSGVGKGNLITTNASLIIKENLDSIPKKYGTNT